MNFIIITSIIAIFFINFYFIDEIFKIADPPAERTNDIHHTKLFENSKTALISGDTDICYEISELLKKHNISSRISDNTEEFCQLYPYDYLVAVYKSDLDNLTICSVGIKMLGVNRVVSVCNQHYNKKIYEENSIPYLFGADLTPSDIVCKLLSRHKE